MQAARCGHSLSRRWLLGWVQVWIAGWQGLEQLKGVCCGRGLRWVRLKHERVGIQGRLQTHSRDYAVVEYV